MAIKKPLVITNGQIEQLQAGDTLANPNLLQRTFDSTTTIGQAVYASGANTLDLARANAQSTVRVAGLAAETVGTGNTGNVLADGVLTLTTTQWDAIAGTTGGLTPGANYFLSEATAGNLTETAPATGFVVQVGHALSDTEFEIEVQQPIKL